MFTKYCIIHRRSYKGKDNPNYRGGKSRFPKCIDCNKQLRCLHSKRCYSCANKYRWKDRNYKEKTGSSITKSLIGKKSLKHSLRMIGRNNPAWKGGLVDLQLSIRHLSEYINWRTEVFKRDNYTCQECDKTNCYLEARHIKYFSIILKEFLQFYNQFSPIEDKETLIRLAITYAPFWDITNGKTLCENCHDKIKNIECKNRNMEK